MQKNPCLSVEYIYNRRDKNKRCLIRFLLIKTGCMYYLQITCLIREIMKFQDMGEYFGRFVVPV